jgi:DNA-binding CsgD family transcriptional regulator
MFRGFVAIQKAINHINCLSATGLGDFEDAYEQAVEIGPVGEFPSQNPFALFVAMDLVEAAVRTGRTSEAEAHVDGMKRAGLADISPRLELVVNASSAMVLRTSNDSCRMFEKALCVPGAESYPFELSRVELCYGEHLRRCRRVVESRMHLTEAVQRFRSLGANPWAVRAESELQAAEGARTRCTTTGVGSLTPQELEVAMLAASGLTNKEIGKRLMVSHRTVSAHLYRVFPKLAVKSRAALRDALTDK